MSKSDLYAQGFNLLLAAGVYFVGGPIAAGFACLVGVTFISMGSLREDKKSDFAPTLFSPHSHLGLKRLVIKKELGLLHEEGEKIYHLNDQTAAEKWVTKTRNQIESFAGIGEAKLFLSDAGYTFYSGPGKIKNWVDGRLRRLTELIQRVDSLSIKE